MADPGFGEADGATTGAVPVISKRQQQPGWRRRLPLLLRWTFVIAGIVFLVVVVRDTGDVAFPSWWRIVVAFILAVATLVFLFASWRVLLPEAHGRRLAASFYLSQLGKYIPGAVWQAVAQAGLSSDAGVTVRLAAARVPVHVGAQAAAGGTVGAIVGIVGPSLSWPLRLAALASFALVIAVHPRVAQLGVSLVARLSRRRSAETTGDLPQRREVVASYLLSVGKVVSFGIMYAVVLGGTVAGLGPGAVVVVVTGFSLAWTVGYLAVPFPGGIGIRELVLIAVLAPYASTADILAASVIHRLLYIAAEVMMIVASRLRAGRSPVRP